MKPKFLSYFMDVAQRTSELSYAVRLKVGCVIVKEGNILAFGYNGMPTGWENVCEHHEPVADWPFDGLGDAGSYRLVTKPEVLHAEMNSLMKVARSTESSEGATLFCTHSPCLDCAKAIYQAGISDVYYETQYRSDEGIKFLLRSGIHVHQYDY